MRTIIVHYPDGTSESIVQKVTFTRHGLRDNSLNKTDWGAWNADYFDLPAYAAPTIAGYDADPSFIDALRVHWFDQNTVVNIYYHAHNHGGSVTPVTPGHNSGTSGSQTTVSPNNGNVAPSSSPAQAKLPQTGNGNGFVALLLGTLPTMIAVLALAKRKKHEED